MPNIIEIKAGKTLKLNNVVIRSIAENELFDYVRITEMTDSYIKSKGSQPVGPLVQCTCTSIDEEGLPKVKFTLLWQSNNYIHSTEFPYSTESIMRVSNCLYTRFIGNEINMQHSYNKLSVYAYENDMNLTGATYTVFLDEADDIVTADIFMECITDD